jgi:hypothetical protein
LAYQCLGILQFFAIYLYFEKGVAYSDFYNDLCEFILRSESRPGDVLRGIKLRYEDFIHARGTWGCVDERFGDMIWPYEEFVFLEVMSSASESYAALDAFLVEYGLDEDVYADLLKYQQFMIRKPVNEAPSVDLEYDFHAYIQDRLLNRNARLEKIDNRLTVRDHDDIDSWEEYATKIVWYGRKGGKNFYNDVTREIRSCARVDERRRDG